MLEKSANAKVEEETLSKKKEHKIAKVASKSNDNCYKNVRRIKDGMRLD